MITLPSLKLPEPTESASELLDSLPGILELEVLCLRFGGLTNLTLLVGVLNGRTDFCGACGGVF